MSGHRCRLCGAPAEHIFADLGLSPISNDFVREDDLGKPEQFFPLKALVCARCFLVQLQQFEAPDHHFSDDYVYFSSYSSTWLEHARGYAEQIAERLGLGPRSQVVEVASNDGYLLQYFVLLGIPALGIEPAANTAAVALEQGIPTEVRFFGKEAALELRDEHAADLLIANNVLAHVPDLNDFVAGLQIMLKPGGVITMEFPHLLRLIDEIQFDTIYHEHFSYFSLSTAARALARHGLTIFDVEELPTHGGSLRVYARHAARDGEPVSGRVEELLAREERSGYGRLETYLAFPERVQREKRAIVRFLVEAKESGQSIVGYGAPAKGNTLLNYCGIRTDFIEYTVDRNPHKQGRYLPGTRIPVRAPEEIRRTRPDLVFILPWNLRDEIVDQLGFIREWGGRFAARSPELRVIA
ncbi:MAG: methyltransferase domain-containing protein [Gaiellaceae bacterium]